jgi:FkbM family methyltransferase
VFQLSYQRSQVTETNIRHLFREILGSPVLGCSKHVNDGVVLDVGANEGFYGLLSSAYGCRTISFEPQPTCVTWLSWAAAANQFKHPLKVIQKIVSKDGNAKFKVPRKGCSGMTQYLPGMDGTVEIGSIPLDDVVEENGSEVLVVHMDVEGAEIHVLESAVTSIQQKKIKNVIFEMNYARWPAYGVTNDHALATMEQLIKSGYVCRDLKDVGIRYPLQSITPFESFTKLRYESESDIWCTCMPGLMKVVQQSGPLPNDESSPGHISVNPGKEGELP